MSQLIDLGELTWDSESGMPYLVDPEARRRAEAEERKAAETRRFAALIDGVAAIWACDESDHPWVEPDGGYDYMALDSMPMEPWHTLAHAVGCAVDWETARRRLGCWSVLPHLYAVRDGRGYGGMNPAAVVMNLLEHRRWATHAVVAVARAYGRDTVLDDRPKAAAKVRRNIQEASKGVPGSLPARSVDGMLAALFPEAAAGIRQPWPPLVALEYLRAKAAGGANPA